MRAHPQAHYLARHPLVKKVNYAGLSGHAGYDVHMRQATSGGALLSFETGSVEASKVVVEETKLFKITVSFGNVNSLISLPCYMSHASIPADVRAARGLPDDLVRISAGQWACLCISCVCVCACLCPEGAASLTQSGQSLSGIENGDDLVADLDQAMTKAMEKIGFKPQPDADNGDTAALSETEQQMLQRIRQLEEMVRELATGRQGGNGKQ